MQLYIFIGGRVKQAQPFKGFGSFDLGGEFIHGSNTVVNKLALDNGWLVLPVSTTYVPVTLTASVSWCYNPTEGDTGGRSRRGTPGGYWGKFLLGMCRWPVRALSPL